jgi:uncharacterized protein YndB with AHSA1/START domain
MDFETERTIAAPAEQVWSVLTDVRHWPSWTASVTTVEPLEPGPLSLGARVRVVQPRLAPAVYEVDDLTPGSAFAWTASTAGVTTTAGHYLSTNGESTVRVRFTVAQRGLLAWPLGLLFGPLVRRYMGMEADGLKRRCENGAT